MIFVDMVCTSIENNISLITTPKMSIFSVISIDQQLLDVTL